LTETQQKQIDAGRENESYLNSILYLVISQISTKLAGSKIEQFSTPLNVSKSF